MEEHEEDPNDLEEENLTIEVDDTITTNTVTIPEDWETKWGFTNVVAQIHKRFTSPLRPRRPGPEDEDDWIKTRCPTSMKDIFGNEKATSSLQERLSGIGKTKSSGEKIHFILHGVRNSGKSSLLSVYCHSMYPDEEYYTNVMLLDIPDFKNKAQDMFAEITGFMKSKRELPPKGKYFIIALDNFQDLPPKDQQQLRVVMDGFSKRYAQFILLCRPAPTMIVAKIMDIVDTIQSVKMSTEHILEMILTICTTEQIGYSREAIDFLMEHVGRNPVLALATLQQSFLQYEYLSVHNLHKATGSTFTFIHKLNILDMAYPLRRCRTCTLIPPCKHTSLDNIWSRLERLRNMYPQDTTRFICPTFKRRGICTVYERKGKCAYDHPLDLHVVDTSMLKARCEDHTLPKPCSHCRQLQQRKRDLKALENEQYALKDIIQSLKKNISGIEIDLYIHIKKGTEVDMWGSIKKAFDKKTTSMENKLETLHVEVQTKEDYTTVLQQTVSNVRQSVLNGKTAGVGKGHGKFMDAPSLSTISTPQSISIPPSTSIKATPLTSSSTITTTSTRTRKPRSTRAKSPSSSTRAKSPSISTRATPTSSSNSSRKIGSTKTPPLSSSSLNTPSF